MENTKNSKANVKKIAKKKRNVLAGIISIQASFNNTIVSVADTQGNVISWSSAGKMGFRGSKKSTPYAAQVATNEAVEKAKECGLQTAKVQVLGGGVGRESALRILLGSNIVVTSIEDLTHLPHNGCRAPKRRRV
ncbi:MAG: 30S ribosomal protein S11 [Rickettsiales bacterium]|jgi:small subunit ribosomal protein S11|nr:30S ribosomal protein S11 [Rickettsiales bacterium]